MPAHHQQRRRVVRSHRHREQQGHQDLFAWSGKVKNTGLIEVPMGITLREIVYDIGGGIPKRRKFKAVQTGGPSGGCIPAEPARPAGGLTRRLTEAGSMMGSGGMIVMDDRTCMVDIARYFLDFLKDESCGKCTPCREGIRRMLEILTRITEGQGADGRPGDARDAWPRRCSRPRCAAWASRRPTRCSARCATSATSTRSTSWTSRPAGVCRELIAYHDLRGEVHRLRAVPQSLPAGRHHRQHEAAPRD